MKRLFSLEAYHWDKDYWDTVGIFDTKELALQGKSLIEKDNENVSCTIFEKTIINNLTDIIST